MTYNQKAKKYWRTYVTRKDWYHKNADNFFSWYPKKFWRKYSNKQVRMWKDDLSSGGEYKRIFDLWWTIF